jgi:putative ABC transport system permease protein
VNALISHLRYTIRLLLRSPGFTITTVLIMGLGIGANTAIFSVVHAVLLQSLPYPESGRLFTLSETNPVFPEMSVAYPNYLDWRASQHSFEDLSAYRLDDFNLTGSGEPERIRGAFVTASYFRVLGLGPRLGRTFAESDDRIGGANVVVLGERFWRSRFGADPKVIGRTLVLNDIGYEVIGVAPAQLTNPERVDIYAPFGFYADRPYLTDRDDHPGLVCIGRLRQGVSVEEAAADLAVISKNLESRYPDTNAGDRIKLTSLLEGTVGQYRMTLFLLLAVVSLVLLIACANVANLVLGRAIARQKELALRAALGASRGRIIAQLLTESILLALVGGALGLIFACWSTDAIIALAPHEKIRFQQIQVNGSVLLFTAVVTLGSGLLFGFWPTSKLSRTDLNKALENAGGHGSTVGGGRLRSQGLLVVSQVALASVLLVSAGLLIQSLQTLQKAPLGFDPHHLLTAGIKLSGAKYGTERGQPAKIAEMAAFYDQLLERIQNLPGTEAAALSTNPPFNGSDWQIDFAIAGRPDPKAAEEPSAECASVSPDYFRAMRIQLLRGRAFNAEDRIGKPPVAIIDESLANRFFPDQDPIGQQIRDNVHSGESVRYTIVGIVGTVRHDDPGELPKFAQLYLPVSQRPDLQMTILFRTGSDPLTLLPTVRQAVQSLNADLPVFDARTKDSQLATKLATQRLSVILVSLFSVLALILAAVGLYGVLAYSIVQRTREIGIRIALGAQSRNILGSIIRQAFKIVGVGLAIGMAGAIGLTRLIQSMLYGVSGTDPVALLTAVGILGLAAFLACLVPALRATRIDPITALRE